MMALSQKQWIRNRRMNYLVRHGVTRTLGEFEPLEGAIYQRSQRVIIQSPRGTETEVLHDVGHEGKPLFI